MYQLWIMHGPNWSLPVQVTLFDTIARVHPHPLPLPDNMRKALTDQIAALSMPVQPDWFLTREVLERFADPAFDLPPEECVSWVRPVGRRVALPQPEGMEGFYEAFTATGFVRTAGCAQLLFGAYCKHIMHWLVNKKQPVDLGFCVLEPLPARPNWRELAMRRVKNRQQRAAGNHLSDIMRRTKPENIIDDRWLMYHPARRHLLWSVTIRHKRPWWKAVIMAETERRRRRPARHGLLDARQFLQERKEAIYACFRDYLAQIRYPFPVLPKSGSLGRGRAKQLHRGIKVRNAGSQLHPVAALDWRTGEARKPAPVAGKDTGLSEVPYLLRGRAYMRKERERMAKSRDAENGAAGVQMLATGESTDGGS